MKNRNKVQFVFVGLFLCAAGTPVFAQMKSKEEIKLETSAAELNKNYSEGRERVTDKIKSEFKVNYALLVGLHFKNMKSGDIAIALGMAKSMHGGIKDENLHKIVTMREGPPAAGWGRIAKKLGVKLGPVITSVRKIAAEVRKQEKADIAGKIKKENAEKAAKKAEEGRPGKAEKEGMKSLARP